MKSKLGDYIKVSRNSRKFDVLLTLFINIIFFIIYMCFFELLHETNDDWCISLMMEGAYGEYSEYAIYQHVWWGKIVVALSQFLPQFKWYVILMYMFVFLGFCGMVYAFLRMQGRRMGVLTSGLLLIFCGYQTYVHFQYSRIATVVAAAGLILIFFALEYASDKIEKVMCLISGVGLAIWASMIRFQMFAVAVALVGGAIGLYKVWKLYREKEEGWLKKIGIYVAVFGTVGIISVGLYAIDRAHYTDERWTAYNKFNELRTELWDYGFPDYYENYDLYQSLGINENDYAFYLSWNLDAELLTVNELQALVDAKAEKVFAPKEFFALYPKNFISLSVFVLFLVLTIVGTALNKKNLYYGLYGLFVIMVLQAYFYTMGRYGIPRIDYSMWMAAVIALMYGMSDDIRRLQDVAWKWVVATLTGALLIGNADIEKTPLGYEGAVGYTKFFYEQVTPDKEHLYVIMVNGSLHPYYAFHFWEPSEQGELSNIYNAFGWEQNVPVKDDILNHYEIENIYRDSINNEKVYFVTGAQTEMLQMYVQQNYNPNAYLVWEKEVYGIPIYSLRTAE